MDIQVKPLPGCNSVFLGVLSLGIAPLIIKIQERRWPASVDEQGLTTKSGKQIAWQDFTKAVKVIQNTQGTMTERYDLHYADGVVPIVVYRLENGPRVLDYILEHLPETVFDSES